MAGANDERVELEVGVIVRDLHRMEEFWRELGFEPVMELSVPVGEIRRLRRDSARIKLFAPSADVECPSAVDPWWARSGVRYISVYVPDVEETFARAVASGATPVSEPRSHRPGAIGSMVLDPEGNTVEFLNESRPTG